MEIDQIREEIRQIDEEMTKLFVERMNYSQKIAFEKKKASLPVYDDKQEVIVKTRYIEAVPEKMKSYYEQFVTNVMDLSKKYQSENLYEAEEK